MYVLQLKSLSIFSGKLFMARRQRDEHKPPEKASTCLYLCRTREIYRSLNPTIHSQPYYATHRARFKFIRIKCEKFLNLSSYFTFLRTDVACSVECKTFRFIFYYFYKLGRFNVSFQNSEAFDEGSKSFFSKRY